MNYRHHHTLSPDAAQRIDGEKPALPRDNLFSQIATKVGVTGAAVTMAMQDSPRISLKTKQRVFWASRQLEYRRSRARELRLMNIAVIVGVPHPDSTLQSSGDVGIWEGLSRSAEQHELALHTYMFYHEGGGLKFEDLPPLLRRDQLDGVVVLGIAFPTLIEFLHKARVPTVVASNFDLPRPVDQVRIDYREGARLLTSRLVERGHKRIGFIAGEARLLVEQQIYQGYEEVLRSHKLHDPALVKLMMKGPLRGLHPAEELLKQTPRPTAIVATHPHGAYQIALAAATVDIPFDSGFEIASANPTEGVDLVYPLYYINSHTQAMGRLAFERLMELHREPQQQQQPKTSMILCSIEERRSPASTVAH